MRGGRFLGKAGKASVRVEGQTDQHQIAAFYCWARVGSDTPLFYPRHSQTNARPLGKPRKRISPALVPRLVREISDEYILHICQRPAYRCSGVHRGVVGDCWSGAVRVCHHHPGAALLVASA